MGKKIELILKEVLEKIDLPEEDIDFIEKELKKFLECLKKKIDENKIKVDIFIGGSFAKKTMIKKYNYDIDIFLRFDKKYNDDLSNLAKKILRGTKNLKVMRGSRDYFRIKINTFVFFEIVPVLKINNPKQAENVTDLSYSHIRYLNNKIKSLGKSKKILDEIKLAKAFCHANNCYGAESYICGFSGYGLELLVYYYGGFLKFIKAMGKIKDEKVVIDIEKRYKSKQDVLMNINSSKLQSPIVLVDPTYKQRNVLAALSRETFEIFKKDCINFLKDPSIKYFEKEKIDLKKIKKSALRKNYEFVLIIAKTDKQEGDIAGSKLLKFYRHIEQEIAKSFDIKDRGFNYNDKKSAEYFFVSKNRKNLIIKGPNIEDKENSEAFKKKHKKTFVKREILHAEEKIELNLKSFLEWWKHRNKKKMRDMRIVELKILN